MYITFVFLLTLISPSLCIFGPKDLIYDEAEAKKLFEIVASAHHKNDPTICFNITLNEHNVKLIGREDVVCDILGSKCTFVIAEFPNTKQLVVAIRGTQSMSQFFYEFAALFIPDGPYIGEGLVSHYFSITHAQIWSTMATYLKKEEFKNHDVLFTGHSLGSALTALSALRTILEGIRSKEQVKLYSFAQPRSGNFEFAKFFDSKVKYKFRVLNRGDLLAKMPGCYKDFRLLPTHNLVCDHRQNGPYHHMREVWYPDGMERGARYIVCDSAQGEDPFCSNSLHISLKNFGQCVVDHRMFFGVMVSQYGESGCQQGIVYDEGQGLLGMIKKISEFFYKIWIF